MTNHDKLLPRAALEEMFGVQYGSIYRWIKVRGFPRSILVGPQTARWSEIEVLAWIERQKASRRAA